jgi:hypothetical protein
VFSATDPHGRNLGFLDPEPPRDQQTTEAVSKEGYGSKRAVLPMMMMMMIK